MNRVPFSVVLDLLARAGADGIALAVLDSAGKESLDVLLRAGFPLRFEAGRAYLVDDGDCLAGEWIRREAASTGIPEPKLLGFLEVDSTNTVGLELCREGAPHWTLIYAECQHAGRGRFGRVWASPAHLGLYFSVILRPSRDSGRWPLLSLACGWAVAVAISELARASKVPEETTVRLKWPNDVLVSGRKVAGVLLEHCSGAGTTGGAVAGIGINVRSGSVPGGLEAEATSLGQERLFAPRRKLLIAVIRRVHEAFVLFDRGSDDELLKRWGECSGMHNNSPVWISTEGRLRPALTQGLDRSGGLKVRFEDGVVETLMAGDVSIRPR